MKTIVLPLILVVSLLSCKKEVSDLKVQDKVYVYRLASVDLDSVVSYSTYASIRGSVDAVATEDDRTDCREHPNRIGCKTMPVILEYFKVYKSQDKIRITWKSVMEYSLAFYEIQRSEDGQNFKTITIVKPKGVSVYDVEDN
jgi:hypothetical protein